MKKFKNERLFKDIFNGIRIKAGGLASLARFLNMSTLFAGASLCGDTRILRCPSGCVVEEAGEGEAAEEAACFRMDGLPFNPHRRFLLYVTADARLFIQEDTSSPLVGIAWSDLARLRWDTRLRLAEALEILDCEGFKDDTVRLEALFKGC